MIPFFCDIFSILLLLVFNSMKYFIGCLVFSIKEKYDVYQFLFLRGRYIAKP